MPSLVKGAGLPKKSKELLEQIRKAEKCKDWSCRDELLEGFRKETFAANQLPAELDKIFTRSIRSGGPFQTNFAPNKAYLYKAAALKKLKLWNGDNVEIYEDWFKHVNYWLLNRALAGIETALARDTLGNLTSESEEFLERLLLAMHVQTFAKGGDIYMRNGVHHLGEFFQSLPETVTEFKEELRLAGGFLYWLKTGGYKRNTPWNIYNKESWTARSKESMVKPSRTAPVYDLSAFQPLH